MEEWDKNEVSDDVDADDNEESTEYFSNLVSGPYMHIFLENLRRDIQKSAKNGKKKTSSRRWDDDQDVEPPKHEPPPKPLRAENLKSAMKTKKDKLVVNKGQRRKNSRNYWPKEEGDKGSAGEGGGIDRRHKDFDKNKGKKNGLKEGDRQNTKGAAAGGEGECKKKSQKNQHKGGAVKGAAGGDVGRGGADKDRKKQGCL
ncbi:hypothetical protein ACH5RR_036393 [Cinchona calisaya]|uniref:Uncharacterized protein n=1 Tax=Cinchona calisaya TaxID=153742 RepID=A0ABD2Y335_9GENT